MNSSQATAAVRVVSALAEAIRDLGQVPSGRLYASVMGVINLSQYQEAIRILIAAGLVENHSHLLVWVGPTKEES
jgi:hypothetical protein